MIRIVLISAALIVGVTAQTPQDRKTPDWLAALIKQLESQPVANPPARLVEFAYRGQTVYYLPPRCCDIPSELYDAKGAVMCSPDGGLTGRGDGKCADFFAERKNERVVWADRRRPSKPQAKR